MGKTKTVALLIFVLALALSANAQCGKERWPVKTLQDSGAVVAGAAPVKTTVAQLLALPAPSRTMLLKANDVRFQPEKSVYEVEVLIMGFKKESDSDFHIVIAGPENPAKTMISEIPSGSCTKGKYEQVFAALQKQFIQQVGNPSASYKKLPKPIPATFTGLGFFDFLHGQTGVAANGIELHPITAFVVHK